MTVGRGWLVGGSTVVLLLVIAVYGIRREKEIAIQYAESTLGKISGDPLKAEQFRLPPNLPWTSFKLGDTDHFDRNWTLWFDGGSNGRLVMNIHAARGIGFVPLFNTSSTLSLESIEYVP